MRYRRTLFQVIATLSVCSYAWGVDESVQTNSNPSDPFERFNRVMFSFNDFLDNAILKPIANLYNKIIPKPLSKGFSNVYANIDNVPTVLNDLLQANFYQATSDAWRLGINSTIGIGGLFDFAADMGLERNSEDFGLTLAQWGYKKSNYIVLPFLGPLTIRDAIGWPINYNYMTIYPYINPINTRYAIYGFGIVVRRADLARYENVMEQAAIDKYVFIRDAYMQRRAYLIQRNEELGNPYLEKSSSNASDATTDTAVVTSSADHTTGQGSADSVTPLTDKENLPS